jgi:hypothetical protein
VSTHLQLINIIIIIIIIIITAMVWTCPKNGGGETTKISTEMAAIREKKTR